MSPTTTLFVSLLFWSKICWSSQETTSHQEEQSRLLNQLLDKYDNRIIPHRGNGTDDPVVIKVNWMLRQFTGISDYDMDFGVQITFRMEWTDERLKYEDNGKIKYLTLTDTSKVWVPDLFFSNEKDGHLHKLTAPNTFYRIYPSGHVLYSSRLSLTLWCFMELEKFPFDSHICNIRLASYAYTTNDIILEWKKENPIQVLKAVRIVGFTLGKFDSSECHAITNTGEYACLIANFFFKRNLEYYVLHTFLPSTLLVIVSWASFWLDRREVVARILLVLSTLFAMSSFSSDIESSVPNVSYMKAMDLWVGTCFTFLLLALVEFAVVNAINPADGEVLSADSRAEKGSAQEVQKVESTQDSQVQEKSTSRATTTPFYQPLLRHLPTDPHRIDSTARVLFPTAFLAFVVLYVTVFCFFDSSA